MRKAPFILLAFCIAFSGTAWAQETFLRNGVQDHRDGAYAFVNATVVVDSQTRLESATLLIRDGKIMAVGRSVPVPLGYTVVDLKGRFLYPSLIDMHTHYGQPEVKRGGFAWGRREQLEPKTPGPYNANDAIRAQVNGAETFSPDEKSAGSWRAVGFGTVVTFHPDGLARGTAALVTLSDERANRSVIRDQVSTEFSFDKGSSEMSYPASLMGAVAVLRQTYLDADWYAQFQQKPFTDRTLEAWLATAGLPKIFTADSWANILRADAIGDEFGVQYIIKGGGDEYRRIDLLKQTGAPLIVPIHFPEPFDVQDPIENYRLELADLKHWELAPANLALLEKNGFDFAITADGLKEAEDFWPNLRKAIRYGLSPERALQALTEVPARLLGVSGLVGSLEKGKLANFLVTSGPLEDAGTVLYENWIQGKRFKLAEMDLADLAGAYQLTINGTDYRLEVSGEPGQEKAAIPRDGADALKVDFKREGDLVALAFTVEAGEPSQSYSLSGWRRGQDLVGTTQGAEGNWIDWAAVYQGPVTASGEGAASDASPAGSENRRAAAGASSDPSEPPADLGPILYPFTSYGSSEVPQPEEILIRNATVWTMEADGVLEHTDVRLQGGKIVAIGRDLPVDGARVIDGTGKHVTPGIIDEHSHVAGGGNDVLSNSAMVRISDQLDSEQPAIYQALSGGVTTIQVLHGSADPIGGQSAIIKLRWGVGPQQLKLEDADPFIKFALGENVKRSSSQQSIRYPQTRMGVEQVFVDAFTAAVGYEKEWSAYNALTSEQRSRAIRPRRDLALDALVEILHGRRFITCHSYVQSEINMLMKVAERFGFRVNTFTHILEGYKVADKMAAHGAAGSSFSDWWAYKWEVRYAIPYNAAIMQRAGVVTAINSDDAEMMRRLNQEAAKSIKYGGVSELEAMAMVTINPARMLHLDQRIGSLRAGKDADVVVWSGHPLSIYSRPEQTIVDGAVFFDIERDQALRLQGEQERLRLIRKMAAARADGAPTRKARGRSHPMMERCDDVITYDASAEN